MKLDFSSLVKAITQLEEALQYCASDLDLAIDIGRPLIKKERMQLFNAFEGSDLPYTVDVVDLFTVNENLKKIIEEEKKPLNLSTN